MKIKNVLLSAAVIAALSLIPTSAKAANLDAVNSGKTGNLSFENNSITNTINGKTYILENAPDGSSGGSFVDTPYGKGLQITKGGFSIPTSELNAENSNVVTVSFLIRNSVNDVSNNMPIAAIHNILNDALFQSQYGIGFHSGDDAHNSWDYLYTKNSANVDNYTLLTAEFNGNVNNNIIYINGVKQSLGWLSSNRSYCSGTIKSINFGNTVWGDHTHDLNGSIITNVQIWNRALTDEDANTVYADSLVKQAETSKSAADIGSAQQIVSTLSTGADRDNLQTRLDNLAQINITIDNNSVKFADLKPGDSQSAQINCTVNSNATYRLKIAPSSDLLKGSKYTADLSHILFKLEGSVDDYRPLTDTVQVLKDNISPGENQKYVIDIKFTDDWSVKPDTYTIPVQITVEKE